MSRSADWASIREAVLRRDNYKCVECGTTSCDGWWSKRRRDRAQHHAPGRAQDSASACAVYATVVGRFEVRPSSAIRATCRHSARKRKYDFVTVWDRMLSSDADAFDLDQCAKRNSVVGISSVAEDAVVPLKLGHPLGGLFLSRVIALRPGDGISRLGPRRIWAFSFQAS